MFKKKNEGEIRTTSNIENLNVFIISRAGPLEMLKKCPSWKNKMIPDRNMDLLKKKKKRRAPEICEKMFFLI